MLFDLGLSSIWGDVSTQTRTTKANHTKGLRQTKKLLHSKGSCQQNERATCHLRRSYLQMTSDKGFIPKTCKKLTQLNIKKSNNPIKKWAEAEETFLHRTYMKGQQVH